MNNFTPTLRSWPLYGSVTCYCRFKISCLMTIYGRVAWILDYWRHGAGASVAAAAFLVAVAGIEFTVVKWYGKKHSVVNLKYRWYNISLHLSPICTVYLVVRIFIDHFGSGIALGRARVCVRVYMCVCICVSGLSIEIIFDWSVDIEFEGQDYSSVYGHTTKCSFSAIYARYETRRTYRSWKSDLNLKP